MKTMTISVQRKPLMIQINGQEMRVEELSVRLPFARKPAGQGRVRGQGTPLRRSPCAWPPAALRGSQWQRVR